MPIMVEFPGGEIREVPSVPRKIRLRKVAGGPASFDEEPAFNPNWLFEAGISGNWWARPRRPLMPRSHKSHDTTQIEEPAFSFGQKNGRDYLVEVLGEDA